MQLGGLKGQTIVQVSHVLHLRHGLAIKKQHSCAFLFIDVQSAFYRLLRRHLITSQQDTRGLQELFRSLNLASPPLCQLVLINQDLAIDPSHHGQW